MEIPNPPPQLSWNHWDQRFLDLAQLVSTWSKDPSKKIGCVVVSPERTILSTGYNGFPRGTLDEAHILADKQRKRLRSIHAEINALHFASGPIKGATVYITHFPCATCAASLIQHQPARVVYNHGPESFSTEWKINMEESKQMLEEAQIIVSTQPSQPAPPFPGLIKSENRYLWFINPETFEISKEECESFEDRSGGTWFHRNQAWFSLQPGTNCFLSEGEAWRSASKRLAAKIDQTVMDLDYLVKAKARLFLK